MHVMKTDIRTANIIEEGRYAGPQVRILGVAERLKAEGIKTLVICPEEESEHFYTKAVKRKVEICRIPMHRLSRNPTSIFRYFITFPKEVYFLYRMVKKENIDIVHCNSIRQLKGVVAGWFARKKVIWHLQDTRNNIIIRAFFFTASFLVDYFIAAGERVREYYLRRFPLSHKPVKIIQAPVNTYLFDPNLVSADQRIESSPGVKVVSVGNINPAKAYQYLIKAASYLNLKNNEVSFWIVGPVFESQQLYYSKLIKLSQKLNVKNVNFYGKANNVRAILKGADIYVCSSIHEASPISIWEAMSMGRAIISTDVGDVNRFIKNGVNGFIVPIQNPKALANKINILLNAPELRNLFGQRSRLTAIQHLDVSICVRKHAEAYRELLNND
ncbi:hypothetical protein C6A37_05120 [Desulfobacteraceae bacterium SEEP-SAG9]|nr:hypothetical protein C6A37_05120 [Desulfobacteraceae bacterium SEEP-SAG9]